jgi:hypothetical protein
LSTVTEAEITLCSMADRKYKHVRASWDM